jgi:hypothetical protein
MITLTRDQFIARLLAGYALRVGDGGRVYVDLRDAGMIPERVPALFFAEFRAKGLIEEAAPGEWRISDKGWRRLRP